MLRVLAEYSVNNAEHVQIFEGMRYRAYTLEKIMWDKLKEQYNKYMLGNKNFILLQIQINLKPKLIS